MPSPPELDAGYRELVEERNRLVAARAALRGERAPKGPSASGGRRLSQDEVAEYLQEHPGSKAGDIARALDVPLTNVSAHPYRGKQSRFEARGDGWHVREPASVPSCCWSPTRRAGG
jgi:hypothetical protein